MKSNMPATPSTASTTACTSTTTPTVNHMDIDRSIHERYKGVYVYFGCLTCGKTSLLGNLAQRIRERHMPVCHGKNMRLIEAEDKALQVALKAKRGEKLTQGEVETMASFAEGGE